MEEFSYVLTQYFVSCVHVCFYFSLPLIFTLMAASISHFSPLLWIFHVFFLRNSSPLFSITRSFSVIHVSVNTKNNAEKDTTLFFLKVRAARILFMAKQNWMHLGSHTCWLSYFTLVCLWWGRTVARSLCVRSRDYQIFWDGWITTFP